MTCLRLWWWLNIECMTLWCLLLEASWGAYGPMHLRLGWRVHHVSISNQISSLDSCKKSVQDESPNSSKHLNLYKMQYFTKSGPPPKKKKFKETTGKPFMPTTPLMAFHPQILHLNLETIPMSSTFVITNSSWTSLLAPQHLDRASLLGLSLLNDLGKTSRQDGSGSTMVLQNTW